jgi:hypothetical protein
MPIGKVWPQFFYKPFSVEPFCTIENPSFFFQLFFCRSRKEVFFLVYENYDYLVASSSQKNIAIQNLYFSLKLLVVDINVVPAITVINVILSSCGVFWAVLKFVSCCFCRPSRIIPFST